MHTGQEELRKRQLDFHKGQLDVQGALHALLAFAEVLLPLAPFLLCLSHVHLPKHEHGHELAL